MKQLRHTIGLNVRDLVIDLVPDTRGILYYWLFLALINKISFNKNRRK